MKSVDKLILSEGKEVTSGAFIKLILEYYKRVELGLQSIDIEQAADFFNRSNKIQYKYYLIEQALLEAGIEVFKAKGMDITNGKRDGVDYTIERAGERYYTGTVKEMREVMEEVVRVLDKFYFVGVRA